MSWSKYLIIALAACATSTTAFGGPSDYEFDDQLFGREQRALRARLHKAEMDKISEIDAIMKLNEPTVTDFDKLTSLARSLYVNVQAKATSALPPMIVSNPAIFSAFLTKLSSSQSESSQYIVATLLELSTTFSGGEFVLNEIVAHDLASHEAILSALELNTGLSPIRDGFAHGGLSALEIGFRNMAAQIPNKLAIALALHERNVRDKALNTFFVSSLHYPISPELKSAAIEKLGEIGGSDADLARTLKRVVIPLDGRAALPKPPESVEVALAAISALGKIRTQESVDALWEIEGRFTSRWARESIVPTDAVAMAKLARTLMEELTGSGEFKKPGIGDRLGRSLAKSLNRLTTGGRASFTDAAELKAQGAGSVCKAIFK